MCVPPRRLTLTPMMIAFKLALWIHVLAGTVALSVFWLPLVTKKGGLAHRRVGWVYVVAAATIALTTFLRSKGRTTASRDPVDLLPPALLVAGGVALTAYALQKGVVLFGVFAALGM